MSSQTEASTTTVDSVRKLSVMAVLGGLSFGSYAISQGAIRAQELGQPVVGPLVSGGAGSASSVAREGMGMWNLVGNHIVGAPAFALFSISLSAFIIWRWDSAVIATLASIVLSLATFAGAVNNSFGAVAFPSAYFGAAVLLGILYGGFGVGTGLIARSV